MLTETHSRRRAFQRNQAVTPYFDALHEYVDTGVLTFHVPGHQQGKGSPARFRDFIARNGLAADITQVLGMDDIHRPVSVCKEAQELAADAYGVEHTYFLINGSSSGNHAMILASLRPEDVVLVPRNAHRSTVGALILSGARPVFYTPEYDHEMVVDHAPTPESVEAVLEQHPEATALFFTSPTYYGATADVHRLVKLGHDRDMIVMADEAWGPHLVFHDQLPPSAVEAGADLVIHSTHKLLAGMSQASMLHLTGKRVDRGRLEAVLKLFLSTSPSCLLVASLDVARHQMATQGQELLGRTIRLANQARAAINEIPGVHCYGEELLGRPGVFGWDPTRVVITARDLGFTGYELERYVRYEHNIQLEMSDLFNAVALVTIGHSEEHIERLVQALHGLPVYPREFDLKARLEMFEKKRGKPFELPDFPPQAMTLRQAFDAPFLTVPLEQSVGATCAELVTPYPPGIPVLCPGETITAETVDYLKMELAAGANIQGPFDPSIKTIRVVDGTGPSLKRK
ncbi:MAG: aminotransferase class I/II-fold pyridoxal phosphate-dependent enzyme [Candidatus Eremiobacterota bacterium]